MTEATKYTCMVTCGGWNYCDYFEMYINVKSLYYTPENNIILSILILKI